MNNILSFFNSNVWATIEGAITIATLWGVLYGLYRDHVQQKRITVYVEKGDDKRALGVRPRRINVTRSEIKGILSDANSLDGGFSIKNLNTQDFINDIEDIQSGKKSELVVKISDGDRFELKKAKSK